MLTFTVTYSANIYDEIEDKAITSTWDEVYANPIQFFIELVTRVCAKKI